MNTTPNEIAPKSLFYDVYQKLPDLKQIYPFGCRAYWLPDQNKLNSKAKPGTYVGTEFSKGHIILNPDSNKTITRRDIRMHENSFPLQTLILSLQASKRNAIQVALTGPKANEWIKAMDVEIET